MVSGGAGYLRLRVSRAAREGSAAASAAPPSGPILFPLRRKGGRGEGGFTRTHGERWGRGAPEAEEGEAREAGQDGGDFDGGGGIEVVVAAACGK